jgi:peptidoglycan/xylan/chitin deacetylase (PgdA/CDA1 family)
MKDFEDKITEITNGTYETKYYRPPYGYVNDIVKENCAYPIILWNIDTLDWKTHDKESTVNEIKENIFDGAIILMHSIRPSSVEATEEIIPYLINEGYEIVTIEEMFKIRGVEQIPGKKYRYITSS